jgi:hypothetical protein
MAQLIWWTSFIYAQSFLQRSENFQSLLHIQSSLGKRQPVQCFANLLHLPLSLAVGCNTIDLYFLLVESKLAIFSSVLCLIIWWTSSPSGSIIFNCFSSCKIGSVTVDCHLLDCLPSVPWPGSCGRQVSPLYNHSCKGERTCNLCCTSNQSLEGDDQYNLLPTFCIFLFPLLLDVISLMFLFYFC